MKSRAYVLASGIVQGVYFRDFTRFQATVLGLTGWVRNLPDGRVEATVEGERDKIDRLIEHLRAGPPGSRVDDLQVKWREHAGSFIDFRVILS